MQQFSHPESIDSSGFIKRKTAQSVRVVIVRSVPVAFPVTADPRLHREAKTLASQGNDVRILAWDRQCNHPQTEWKDGYAVHRLRLRAPFGIKVLLWLPIWWCLEFLWLMRTQWDVVHAIDYDTVLPAIVAAKIRRKAIVYEIFDVYEDDMMLPRILRNVCVFIDKLFMRFADAVILVDEGVIEELGGIPNANVAIIYNSPGDYRDAASFNRESSEFTLCCIGALRRRRKLMLDEVMTAVEDLQDVKLVVGGHGDQAHEIKRRAEKSGGKIRFIGKVSYDEVLSWTAKSDLIVALYSPSRPKNRFTSANKLFEAAMFGKPVLVCQNTAMARLVERGNCGVMVDCNSVHEIRRAIVKLKEDVELSRQLGANGRRAYEECYHWDIMEKRLLDLYNRISKGASHNSEIKEENAQ